MAKRETPIYMVQEIRVADLDIRLCIDNDDFADLLARHGIDYYAHYNVRLSPDSEHWIYERTILRDEVHRDGRYRLPHL